MNKKIFFTLVFICSVQIQSNVEYQSKKILFQDKQNRAQQIGADIGFVGGLITFAVFFDHCVPANLLNKTLRKADNVSNLIGSCVANVSKVSFRLAIMSVPAFVLSRVGWEIGKRSVRE